LRSVEFASNEPSVPCEDRVGLGGSRHQLWCSWAAAVSSSVRAQVAHGSER
jgi:hypothetical protein